MGQLKQRRWIKTSGLARLDQSPIDSYPSYLCWLLAVCSFLEAPGLSSMYACSDLKYLVEKIL
jgi:hypothetical protein